MRPWQTASSVALLALASLLILAAAPRLHGQDAKPTVVKDVPYADGGDQRMLDLYLPGTQGFTTVVFTFGGGWHTGGRKAVTAIGQKLQSLGYGCALVSHRLAPQHKFPAQAEDVAAAFAWVHKNIAARGGDPRRVILMGHSSGAHLSLLIATDPQYLAQHKLSAGDIAGVVGLSTPVDLEPHADKKGFGDVLLAGKGAAVFARDAAVMKSASPMQHVSRRLPPTLLVVGEKDFPMLEGDARRFAEKARDVGRLVTTFVSKGRDHMGVVRSLLEDSSDIRGQVLAFIACPAPAAAGEPEPIQAIDAHTHFYDPARPQGVPWPSKDDKLLYRTVLPAEFKALTKKHGIAGAIVVEASPWLEDNHWLLDLAAKDSFIVGIVGNLDISSDDFPKNLKRFAANPLFRGIRISHVDVRKALDQPRLRDHLRLLAKHDLVLDVNGGPDLPADVARLARLLPELRIVINHAANLPIDGKAVPEKWLTGMRAAAAEKNVYCKVSALVEASGRRKGDAPAELAYYRPVLNALWTTFGEDRLIYGSNWPVSDNAAPYATVHRIVDEYFRPRGKPAAAKFFRQNAVAAYKLPRLTPAEHRRLPKESPKGRREQLSLGTLFIPAGLGVCPRRQGITDYTDGKDLEILIRVIGVIRGSLSSRTDSQRAASACRTEAGWRHAEKGMHPLTREGQLSRIAVSLARAVSMTMGSPGKTVKVPRTAACILIHNPL
jgi:L-fuconolactonase